MLEIFAIIGCCKILGAKVRKLGRKAVGYQLMFVLLWFGGEFLGAFLAAASGAREMVAVYVGGLIGAAAGAGLGFLIVSILSDIRQEINYSSQPSGYAPNLPQTDERIDRANPYASPRTNTSIEPPPKRNDSNDIRDWLDQQTGGKAP
jgi:hypothetical protein